MKYRIAMIVTAKVDTLDEAQDLMRLFSKRAERHGGGVERGFVVEEAMLDDLVMQLNRATKALFN